MESDGIEEGMDGAVRVAVTAGARFGESLARMREEQARQAEARSVQESRELQARFEAERVEAVREVRNTERGEWWDTARPEDIGRTYATARAWEDQEPTAAQARTRMESELRTRYGIDTDRLDADPDRVREQLARMEAERNEQLAAQERQREAADREEAARLMSESERLDVNADRSAAAAIHEPDPEDRAQAAAEAERLSHRAEATRDDSGLAYDSVERRNASASELERQGHNERHIETRMRADVAQGHPAGDAVKQQKATKARKSRLPQNSGRQAQLDR